MGKPETTLGSKTFAELRKHNMSAMKLHGSEFQRGLPDYLVWAPASVIVAFELKVASDTVQALNALSDNQWSVLHSLAQTCIGAHVAFGDVDARVCGVASCYRMDVGIMGDHVLYEKRGFAYHHPRHEESDVWIVSDKLSQDLYTKKALYGELARLVAEHIAKINQRSAERAWQ